MKAPRTPGCYLAGVDKIRTFWFFLWWGAGHLQRGPLGRFPNITGGIVARQERAVRTRRAILEAAAAVFDERGYEAATIADILARAGVTKGALYFHFSSKQELAQGVLDEQMAEGGVPRVRASSRNCSTSAWCSVTGCGATPCSVPAPGCPWGPT